MQDQSIFGKLEDLPLFFEDSYCTGPSGKEETKAKSKSLPKLEAIVGKHLFVLVHGFQASSNDMRTIKNHLALLHPEAVFLCSSGNESKTDGDISEMGRNLAEEVRHYIKENFRVPATLARISFVAHSLGGVISRAALPHLEEYKAKMQNFVTFSSPHLGYLFSTSSLINAGMWVLKKWQKSRSLEQLSFSDGPHVEDCFLYKLAHAKGLEWFKNVMLFNSFQDFYAPYESARIDWCQQASDTTE